MVTIYKTNLVDIEFPITWQRAPLRGLTLVPNNSAHCACAVDHADVGAVGEVDHAVLVYCDA